jgi:hypothetical protein
MAHTSIVPPPEQQVAAPRICIQEDPALTRLRDSHRAGVPAGMDFTTTVDALPWVEEKPVDKRPRPVPELFPRFSAGDELDSS